MRKAATSATGGVNMFDTLHAIWQGFVADGTITEAQYAAMTLPIARPSRGRGAGRDFQRRQIDRARRAMENCLAEGHTTEDDND